MSFTNILTIFPPSNNTWVPVSPSPHLQWILPFNSTFDNLIKYKLSIRNSTHQNSIFLRKWTRISHDELQEGQRSFWGIILILFPWIIPFYWGNSGRFSFSLCDKNLTMIILTFWFSSHYKIPNPWSHSGFETNELVLGISFSFMPFPCTMESSEAPWLFVVLSFLGGILWAVNLKVGLKCNWL